jgi:uncharacterized protein (TIGR02421 family)
VTDTPLPTGDLVIDRELADVSASIRFLLDVTPVNLMAARTSFFETGRVPDFQYRPLDDDPDVISARLAEIDLDAVEDEQLLPLFTAKKRELELQLRMLLCRGTGEFLTLSTQLYGTVGPALHGEAEALLAVVDPEAPDRPPALTAGEFAARAEAELAHYREHHNDLDVHVEVRADSSGVMVSNGDLLIAPTVVVAHDRVDSLLQHEIGTHVVTYVNGSHQPLRLLGAGLADYEETQEGLAVFAEFLAGGLTPGRLRQLAARVIAVHEMIEGMDFGEIHTHLVDSGVSPVQAFTITMRVFRSGGLTKDMVYLRGLRSIVNHVGNGGSLGILLLGKMSLADSPHIEALRDRGVLHEPLLTPRYLDRCDARDRLASIAPNTPLSELIGATT